MGVFDSQGLRASASFSYDVELSTTDTIVGKTISKNLGFVVAGGAIAKLGVKAVIENSYLIAVDELVNVARTMGADAVVGIRMSRIDGFVELYGTAVQLREEAELEE